MDEAHHRSGPRCVGRLIELGWCDLQAVFAADVPEKQVKLLAATQRPVTDVA
ncbi:MAG: hypothetical protein JWL65_5794, partial [Gammaproteobacteria bacterium]|nr:hypothetical protein [Gammaproteobacteria bacterium]